MSNLNNNPHNLSNKALSENPEPLDHHTSTSTPHHNTEIHPKHTPNGDNFQRGYLHGRRDQRFANLNDNRNRDNRNATRGLLLGIGLTALLAIGLGLILVPRLWEAEDPSTVIFSEPAEEVEPSTEISPPTQDTTTTTPPENNTTIIENNTRETIRETETQVPVPVTVPNETTNETSQPETETTSPEVPPTLPESSLETTPEDRPTELPTAPENESGNRRIQTEPVNPNVE